MDNTALTLCMDNGIPIIVFDMNEPGTSGASCCGEPIGTLRRQRASNAQTGEATR